MTKIVSTTHNCHCEVTCSNVSAKFSNMRLHGGIRVSVDQHMRIRLPLSTDCECEEVPADSDCEQGLAGKQRLAGVKSSGPILEQAPQKAGITKTTAVQQVTKTRREEFQEKTRREEIQEVTTSTVQSPPKPAPTPPISLYSDNKKITMFLNARDLPKMGSSLEGGSCDPYYVFLLDQGKGFKKFSGGPHLAINSERAHGRLLSLRKKLLTVKR